MRKWLLVMVPLLAVPACAQSVAIRAGNLIDPAKGTVATNQIILVKDKKIVEVGPNVALPEGVEVIDLSKEWVMPGIMDAHTHVTWSAPHFKDLEYAYSAETTGLRTLRGLHMVQILLNAGITTIRDVGNDANFAAVDLRKAIDAGWFTGPTVQLPARSLRRLEAKAKRCRKRLARSGALNITTRMARKRSAKQSAKTFSTVLI